MGDESKKNGIDHSIYKQIQELRDELSAGLIDLNKMIFSHIHGVHEKIDDNVLDLNKQHSDQNEEITEIRLRQLAIEALLGRICYWMRWLATTGGAIIVIWFAGGILATMQKAVDYYIADFLP